MRTDQSEVAARYRLLLEGLETDGRIDVVDFAGRLGVTRETIRRDLRTLEGDGKLHRVYGGAVSVQVMHSLPASPPSVRSEIDDENLTAANWVWRRLPRVGTIMLGAGPLASAVAQVAADDPPERPGVTVVTTCLDAAVVLSRGAPTLAVYLVGGTVSRRTGGQEGQWALEGLAGFSVDTAVVSPTGVELEYGMGSDTTAAAAVNAAIVSSARHTIALVSADALGRRAFVKFADVDKASLHAVVGTPQPAVLQAFLDRQVRVEIVS